MDRKLQKEKIDAAVILLTEPTTTYAKFEKIRSLIKGINPRLDKSLETASGALKQLRHLHTGEIIELITENIPANTEEEKKRKKYLLLFITSWKSLKSEVIRIQGLYKTGGKDGKWSVQSQASVLGKLIFFAKGPLGIITLLALGIMGASLILNSIMVTVTVRNSGCPPVGPISGLPFPIPGIKLPNESITSGQEGVLQLPPLTFSVYASSNGSISLSVLNTNRSFDFGNYKDLIFDGKSLVGKQTIVNLGNAKNHNLIIKCSS